MTEVKAKFTPLFGRIGTAHLIPSVSQFSRDPQWLYVKFSDSLSEPPRACSEAGRWRPLHLSSQSQPEDVQKAFVLSSRCPCFVLSHGLGKKNFNPHNIDAVEICLTSNLSLTTTCEEWARHFAGYSSLLVVASKPFI